MLGLSVDRGSGLPISRQIYDQIRGKIIAGELKSGLRLPPSRQLAEALTVSRNSVMEVYDQLMSEGFLVGKTGSGTYVAGGITISAASGSEDAWNLKKRSFRSRPQDIIDFAYGVPDLSLFPQKAWANAMKEVFKDPPENVLAYGSISGDPELRESLADYLFHAKGIRSQPENILITAGASQALLLLAHTFRESFESIYLEDPSVDFVQDLFHSSGYRLVPVQVDAEGMNISDLVRDSVRKLIFMTPSFQFPTGSILSIQRRQALMDWARKTGSVIIEDGYDSEFRYKGLVAPPMVTMDYDRVLYVGTFSKNLSPGLRLGYLIVPPHLKASIKSVKGALNLFAGQMEQKILATFIGNGQLEKHIYQMKKIYRKKQQVLVQNLKKHFGSDLPILSNDAGMHLIVRLPDGRMQEGIHWQDAAAYGVRIYPLESFSLTPTPPSGKIILGYGNLSLEAIGRGIERLSLFLKAKGIPS